MAQRLSAGVAFCGTNSSTCPGRTIFEAIPFRIRRTACPAKPAARLFWSTSSRNRTCFTSPQVRRKGIWTVLMDFTSLWSRRRAGTRLLMICHNTKHGRPRRILQSILDLVIHHSQSHHRRAQQVGTWNGERRDIREHVELLHCPCNGIRHNSAG